MSCGHCEAKNRATYVCAKCGKEEMREARAGEEVRSCCGEKMVRKEEFMEKMDKQLKELGVQIDRLKDKAAKGTADMKRAMDKDLVVLNKMMKDAQKNMQATGAKTGDAWKVFAEGVDKAWKDLGEAVHRAGEKFK